MIPLRERAKAIPMWAWLIALVAVSTLLRFWAASRISTPWIVPDEVVYGQLGKSLYDSGSFEILGRPSRFYGLVYPALVGLPLSLRDLVLGYDLLKPLQALVMSLAAVPTYLWGRSLMSRWWALAAAALTLTVPGLAYSGLIMTEVAFYPVAALSAWWMARALAGPTLGSQALAAAGILAASATRLQAIVFAPVFVTALLLKAGFERDARSILRFWPTLAAFAAAGAGWAAWRLSSGGPASELFGAYRAAGEVHYTVSNSILYARWHLADVLLMTGVIPACAVAVLVVGAFARRERSADARAYLALATALAAWLVVEVGLFASRHVGRLAERDLLAVVPVLFLGFALWLDRGAPRPRVATWAIGGAALALMLALPVNKLVSLAAIPDAFTLIPLYRLQVRAPRVDLQVVVDLLTAAAVVAFALVPRRLRAALPIAIGIFFALVSLSASRVVAGQATLARLGTVGDGRRWIDETAQGRVAYLYSGEVLWNSVWDNLFWNHRLDRVFTLLTARVPGLTDDQQPPLGPYEDGRLVRVDGRPVRTPYVVASHALLFFGTRVADAAGPRVSLWKVDGPLRVKQWYQEVRNEDRVDRVKLIEYACRGGSFGAALKSLVPQTVLLRLNERPYIRLRLGAGESWKGSVPAPARRPLGKRLCTFAIEPQRGPVRLREIGFVRNRL